MVRHNYAKQMENEEHTAKAVGRDLSISTKHSIEICRFLRSKALQKAKDNLNMVIAKKMAVPFKRFTEIPHRPGKLASGSYPQKASKEILKILEAAESNAQFKGLNTASLMIGHICAHKAGNQSHYGRRGRQMKRTHVEVILSEAPTENTKKKVKIAKEDTQPKNKADKTEVVEEAPKDEKKDAKKKEVQEEAKESKPEIKKEQPEKKEEAPKDNTEEKSNQEDQK